ncbi:MAG TPA: hypothetical protein VMI94_04660 [Bryobacteraceae bacterium]|nr:hypothetical protein [Bryobacteraceae bacterium]
MGPITVTLLIVLGALLFMVLKKLFERPAPPPAAPQPDLASLTVADARVGDNISVSGAGDNMTDLDFTVDHSSRYEAGERQWFDISGKYGGRRVTLEVRNNDDELDVRGFLDGRKLTLEDLGLSEDDLAQMDERQNTADNFEFDGKNWYYLLSKEMGVFHDGQTQGTGFYGWEYLEESGQRYLSIRKREGEPFNASLAVKLNPGDITVFRGA